MSNLPKVQVFLLTGLLAAAPALAAPAAEDDIAAYLDEIDDMYRGRASAAKVTMRVKTAHYSRSMKMRAWSKGKEKSLIRIDKPLKEKGTATLKSGDDIYTYLPKTERTIRLTSGMMMGSWMGSHFTNDDLVKESRMLDDYTAKKVGEEKVDGRRVIAIQLTPKEDAAVVWGKIVTRFDTERHVPLTHVYYDEDGEVARKMSFTNVKTVDGRLRPMTMRIVPADKPDEFTEVVYDEIDFDTDLSDSFFSLGKLRRR